MRKSIVLLAVFILAMLKDVLEVLNIVDDRH